MFWFKSEAQNPWLEATTRKKYDFPFLEINQAVN